MKRAFLPILLLGLCLSVKAQNAYSYDAQVTMDWFNTELYLVKNGAGFTPPVASRALGYAGLAVYEALVPGMPDRRSLASQLQGLSVTAVTPGIVYHWPTVANNCLATITESLWANASQIQMDSMHALRDRYNMMYAASPNFTASRAYGEAVAMDIFNYSMNDGGHEGYLHNTDPMYVPPVGPGLWVPTAPAFAMALQPYWGHNRPFVAADTLSPIIPVAPPTYSTDTNSAFYAYAHQVYVTASNLSPGQALIAQYWADGGNSVTPPGHSMSILSQCIDNENKNLGWSAYAYAKLGMSQTDAFISCWNTKFRYNLLRPITYIQANIDPNWTPSVGTPPFPEYTSGHSTQSGAMTAIMNDLFGSTFAFTDYTHGSNFGGPRSFNCFDEAAYEAATSRLFGGIHYEFSDVFAITLGKMVGENINAMFESVTVSSPESQLEKQAAIRFYPNPTPNYALISFEGFRFGKIGIYDLNGRFVAESTNPSVLDMAGLPAARYLLKIYDAKGENIANQQIQKL